MTKKGFPMDSWFQIYNLNRLEILGKIIVPNSFELDFTLTFTENLKEIQREIKNWW